MPKETKCEYVAELGKTPHIFICAEEATQVVECLAPGTKIRTRHNVCASHALVMEARYGAKKIG